MAPKPEAEQAAEELALGPQIAGRILGARPLWNDAGAQQRVNVIGRWVASQTSRPELPWTFGVIDTPEINAFAAPGGYVLVTRGMYEILSTDGEVAAVLGHEISHCVQRDHYNVIRKQEMAATGKDLAMSEVKTGTDTASVYARQYVEKNGAAIMLTATGSRSRVSCRRSGGDLRRPGGHEPGLALCGIAENDRGRHAVGQPRAAVQDASAAG